jgi:hypothetical protein
MSEELQLANNKHFKSEHDIPKYKSKSSSRTINQKFSRSEYDMSLGGKNKTQSAFNFTTTSQFMISPRLMGISQFQSTNSLQNSIHVCSFTKSDRFNGGVYKKPLSDSMYNLPETKSQRYTTPGYGHRGELSPATGTNSPPPNKYFIKSRFDMNMEKKKGPIILGKINGLVKIKHK